MAAGFQDVLQLCGVYLPMAPVTFIPGIEGQQPDTRLHASQVDTRMHAQQPNGRLHAVDTGGE